MVVLSKRRFRRKREEDDTSSTTTAKLEDAVENVRVFVFVFVFESFFVGSRHIGERENTRQNEEENALKKKKTFSRYIRVDATARVALFREKRADEETSFLKPSSSFVFLATVSSGKKDIILSGVFVVLRGSREKKRRDKNGIENVIVSTEYYTFRFQYRSFFRLRLEERKRKRKRERARRHTRQSRHRRRHADGRPYYHDDSY